MKEIRASTGAPRALYPRPSASPPQTPSILRGESGDSDDNTLDGFRRYASLRRVEEFQEKLYSDEDSDASYQTSKKQKIVHTKNVGEAVGEERPSPPAIDNEEQVDEEHREEENEKQSDQSSEERTRGEERSCDEQSRAEQSGAKQSGADQSGGEQNRGKQNGGGQVIFPGENYRPPSRVNFNRGRCFRTGSTSARVLIKYDIFTATKCPCQDRACTKLVNIGTWGILGAGSIVCVHCGFKRKGEWDGCGYGFMGKEDLVRHLNTAKCRATRGETVQKKSLKEILGEKAYYNINNPTFSFVKKDRDGNMKKYYKCFVCDRTVGFRSRHSHHVTAKHGTDLDEGEYRE